MKHIIYTTEPVEVYALGTKVRFGEDMQYKGILTAIIIREGFVLYEISYWHNHEPKCIEIRPEYFAISSNERKTPVGFINEKTT
jgi:hypothetical protein